MCKLELNLGLLDPNFRQHHVHLLSCNALLLSMLLDMHFPCLYVCLSFCMGFSLSVNRICMLTPIYPSKLNTGTISPLQFPWISSSLASHQNEVAVFPLYF